MAGLPMDMNWPKSHSNGNGIRIAVNFFSDPFQIGHQVEIFWLIQKFHENFWSCISKKNIKNIYVYMCVKNRK